MNTACVQWSMYFQHKIQVWSSIIILIGYKYPCILIKRGNLNKVEFIANQPF